MKTLPHDPVIINAFRTPIGKHGGALSLLRPDDMLALLMQESVKRSNVDVTDIDDVIIGCANQAGEDNRNIARMATLLAGFPDTISGITLNRLCASGLDAVIDGARRIITGEANLVISGGVESMSRAPYVMGKSSSPFRLGSPEIYDSSLGWRFFNESMRERTPPEHNGVTAERLAERYQISRTRQDQFALLSHQKAIASQENGDFLDEIIPMMLKQSRGDAKIVNVDEGPRKDTSLEKLLQLKAAFVDGGTVTAGNSSTLNDGAAIVIMASHEYARARGLTKYARIIGFAQAGVDPRVMGIGPVPATERLLKNFNLSTHDFHSIEINEAFSAQVLAVSDLLHLDEERINPRGGAIALGHPLGCSGARLVCTMVHHLQKAKKTLGLISLCVGVGQGVSMAVEAF